MSRASGGREALPDEVFVRAMEQCPDPVLITDTRLDWPGPTVLFVNAAFEAMSGHRRDEIIGQSPRLLQGPRTERSVLRRLRRQLEAGEDFTGETVNYRRNGEEYQLEWRITALRDEQGRTTHYLSIQRDVTERRRERQRVRDYEREQRRRLRLLTLLHRAAVLAHDARDDNRDDVLVRFAALLPTCLREPARAAARIVYNGRAYPCPGFQPQPPLHRQPLPTLLPEDGFIELVPRRGSGGGQRPPEGDELDILNAVQEVLRLYLICVETEQAQRNGQALIGLIRRLSTDRRAAVEQKCAVLLEQASRCLGADLAVVARRQAGQWTVLHGHPASHLPVATALDVSPLLPPGCGAVEDLQAASSCAWSQAPRHWRLAHGEEGPALQAGLQAPILVQGEVEGYLAFFCTRAHCAGWCAMDAESLQLLAQWVGDQWAEAEYEARSREQREALSHVYRISLLGELTSGLAHELNQPLSAIIAYADAAAEQLEGARATPGEVRRLLDKLIAQAQRASTVMQRVRAFARRDPGRPREACRTPAELVAEIRELIDIELDRGGAALRLDLPDVLPAVQVDAVQIQQVLLNLIRNAVDAMRENAADQPRGVTVSATVDGAGDVVFSVCDTGPGMSEAVRANLFVPFYTTKPDGMGLGLPISQSIIEAHGGRLWAGEPDAGSCLCFQLPAARVNPCTQ
ncbi:PAS domain-containing sensor histidine kinase [Alkalilimnicola ehrlichii MLHE-1]|uniref:histidine kinase n=1 Tax=Alkalilimnicola ehrlichii (strain ATCC BAA-1101 / DSM 17681 / MLHE-1) TaxID=187272 RepID=Q0A7L0_ALKEH|nr:sensor histidine kinase [Alkalilimnicola ehrlichii]ABI57177.1 PAS/PAC sensor signal transduction histidine kinase [Alkalilimnicola ehrlichii MLHE-1]